MKTTSNFAIIDVQVGRKALAKVVSRKGKVPVTIVGYIVDRWSKDDGTSIEFHVEVTSHKIGAP